MRVVERTKDTQSIPYLLSRWVGIFAAVFSVVVAVLMIINNRNVKASDPIHVTAIDVMTEQLAKNPNDVELRKSIQQLDALARREFFNAMTFNRISVYLLFGGLLVMIACFKLQGFFKADDPLPNGKDPRDDIIRDAVFGRWAVGGVGVMLLGFTVILAFTTRNRLAAPSEAAAEPAAAAVATTLSSDYLANWPAFRGPEGNAIAKVQGQVPTKWNGASGENIAWKLKIPKPGFNTPIYWNGSLFMSGADKDGAEVYRVDAAKGTLVWTTPIAGVEGEPAEKPKVQADTGYAASGMATDGKLVFAIFATGVIAGLDFDGKIIWSRVLGVPKNPYGHSSSLIAWNGLVLVQYDHEEGGKLLGLDAATGQTKWETARNLNCSWSSPLVVNTGARWELITSASPVVASYDPLTGKELWRLDALGGEVAPMPSFADGKVFVAADYVKVAAIDLATNTVAWQNETDIPGVSTPLVVNGLMFVGLSDGAIACLDAKTGEEVWIQETDEGFYASPILAGGNVYLMDRGGTMHIFTASRSYDEVGKNALDEQAVASPVFIGDKIFYRAYENLYCIGKGV